MKEKITIEESFLGETEKLLEELLKNHFTSKYCKLDAFTKVKIKSVINRVVKQEIDYLNDDPKNYFEIYGEDHLMN